MLSSRRRRLIDPSPRAAFLARLGAVMGDVRLLWTPIEEEGAVPSLGGDGGPAGTHSATAQGRLSTLGKGLALSFNGTDQYLTTPDSDRLSFGNGTADTAFSLAVLANVTDTAANRALACKWTTTGSLREWIFYVLSTDLLQLQIRDESAGVSPVLVSNSAITQGSWQLFGATYAGVGGASALTGAALYANGAAIASTPTNQAAYVAMENAAGVVEIGSFNAGAAGWMSGSVAMVALCQKALSAGDHAAIAALCRAYFGVAL